MICFTFVHFHITHYQSAINRSLRHRQIGLHLKYDSEMRCSLHEMHCGCVAVWLWPVIRGFNKRINTRTDWTAFISAIKSIIKSGSRGMNRLRCYGPVKRFGTLSNHYSCLNRTSNKCNMHLHWIKNYFAQSQLRIPFVFHSVPGIRKPN